MMYAMLVWVAAVAIVGGEDVVVSRTGERVEGRIVALHAGGVAVLAGSGTREVGWSEVASVESAAAVPVVFGNGDRLTARIAGFVDGLLVLEAPHLALARVSVAALAAPPPKAGSGPSPAVVAAVDAAEAKAPPDKPWKWTVALGGSLTTGNTDTFNAFLEVKALKEWEQDRLEIAARAIYGTAEGEQTAAAVRLGGKGDFFLGETEYIWVKGEAEHDEQSDLALRTILGSGIGTHLIKEAPRLWTLEAGPAWLYADFEDDDKDLNTASLRVATRYADVWREKLNVLQGLEVILPVADPGAFLARSETTLGLKLDDTWSFRTSLYLDWNSDPPGDVDNLDLKLVFGVEAGF